tara:strand:+ start:1781 stop:2197 length:417 start_codon:yes stop_codon:yes gene_type:complete
MILKKIINIIMLKEDFLIINFTGQNDSIGLKVNNKFFVKKLKTKIRNNNLLVNNIFDFVEQKKANINEKFSVLVNIGPGSFSGIRISLSVAKGMKLAKGVKIFGYKGSDLTEFNLKNIELLFKKKLIENNLIKPIYLS